MFVRIRKLVTVAICPGRYIQHANMHLNTTHVRALVTTHTNVKRERIQDKNDTDHGKSFTHRPPSGPVHPALQVQAELPAGASEYDGHSKHIEFAVAPTADEYLLMSHAAHVSDPAAAENFPATHCVHDPPLGPDDPVLQMQAVKTVLPAGELE
jgi:hypothetical protein